MAAHRVLEVLVPAVRRIINLEAIKAAGVLNVATSADFAPLNSMP